MKNPFVGLRPFRSTENELFFGRARETSILRDLALTLPVLTVYAPSGTGKSSLINAGLIPAIRQMPGMIDIAIADPQQEPAEVVRAELARRKWSPGRGQNGLPLARLLEAHYADTDSRVILVLDQFEERIKRSETIDALYAEIAKLANTRSEAATVILSIREDYIAGLDRLMRRVSGLLDAGYRVPPLSRAALAEAVFSPLSIGTDDVTVEEGLVDEVLTDLEQQMPVVGSPERQIEPGYFQIVWHRLWEVDAQAPGAVLTRASYSSEHGAANILKSFVSRILSDLLPYEAALLQASLRYLVLPTGAKVALTVEDLLGLVQQPDVSTGFTSLLFVEEPRAEEVYFPGYGRRRDTVISPRPEVTQILKSLFEQLTRTDAPLFRRVQRGAREEFELMHDLLGNILIEWRGDYEQGRIAAIRAIQSAALSPPEDIPGPTEAIQFVRAMISEASAGRWSTVSSQESSAQLHLIISLLNSAAWRYHDKRVRKHFNEILTLIDSLESKLRPEALRNPDREVRRALQVAAWELRVAGRPPQLPERSSGQWRRVIVSGAFGALASGASAALVTWLAGIITFLPNIEYLGLTVGLAAAGAMWLYAFVYYDELDTGRSIQLSAFIQALWPVGTPDPPARIIDPATGESREPGGAPWWRHLLRWSRSLSYVFLWWPVLFGSFVTACYLGAAAFAAFSWSPTAGFNVAALFAGPLLAIAYAFANDM